MARRLTAMLIAGALGVAVLTPSVAAMAQTSTPRDPNPPAYDHHYDRRDDHGCHYDGHYDGHYDQQGQWHQGHYDRQGRWHDGPDGRHGSHHGW